MIFLFQVWCFGILFGDIFGNFETWFFGIKPGSETQINNFVVAIFRGEALEF